MTQKSLKLSPLSGHVNELFSVAEKAIAQEDFANRQPICEYEGLTVEATKIESPNHGSKANVYVGGEHVTTIYTKGIFWVTPNGLRDRNFKYIVKQSVIDWMES